MLVQKRQELTAFPTVVAAISCTNCLVYKLWFPNRGLAQKLSERMKATEYIL